MKMGKLTALFRDELAKSKDKTLGEEARTLFAHPTGIDVFDYKNGKRITVKGGKPYISVGVDEGTYIMVIGPSGVGKTTFAIQMAKNIVEPYEESQIVHDDIESATTKMRIKNILQNRRYVISVT